MHLSDGPMLMSARCEAATGRAPCHSCAAHWPPGRACTADCTPAGRRADPARQTAAARSAVQSLCGELSSWVRRADSARRSMLAAIHRADPARRPAGSGRTVLSLRGGHLAASPLCRRCVAQEVKLRAMQTRRGENLKFILPCWVASDLHATAAILARA